MTSEAELRRIVREVIRDELGVVISLLKDRLSNGDQELVTREEMAKFLRISLVTLRDWMQRGLPGHRKRKRGRLLFIKSEVLLWLRENPELKFDRKLIQAV